MTNLLLETAEAITNSGHEPKDIIFIGSMRSGHSCTWEEFQTLADRLYDDGFGGQNVASDLIIAFSDGIVMERGEYDGSEWWNVLPKFSMPEKLLPIRSVFVENYERHLAEING